MRPFDGRYGNQRHDDSRLPLGERANITFGKDTAPVTTQDNTPPQLAGRIAGLGPRLAIEESLALLHPAEPVAAAVSTAADQPPAAAGIPDEPHALWAALSKHLDGQRWRLFSAGQEKELAPDRLVLQEHREVTTRVWTSLRDDA